MTFPPDWKDPAAYPEPRTVRNLAWEFLRRNPKYQAAYKQYATRYRSLLRAHPDAESDNAAWARLTNDPRAWICDPPKRPHETDKAWLRRVGSGIRIPLGAWYATFWGIDHEPPDPADNSPGIFWQLAPSMVRSVTGAGSEYQKGKAKVVLGFDLSLPVGPQSAAAKRYLNEQKKYLRSKGNPNIPAKDKRPNRASKLMVQLRLLDGKAAGASVRDLGRVLYPSRTNVHPDYNRDRLVRDTLEAAVAMRDRGYLALLMAR